MEESFPTRKTASFRDLLFTFHNKHCALHSFKDAITDKKKNKSVYPNQAFVINERV